jgi:hypothetical protein
MRAISSKAKGPARANKTKPAAGKRLRRNKPPAPAKAQAAPAKVSAADCPRGLVWHVVQGAPLDGEPNAVPTALQSSAVSELPKTYASLAAWCRGTQENLNTVADYARSLEIKLYYLQQRYTEEVATHGTAKETLESTARRLRAVEERLSFKERERQQLWLQLVRLRELIKGHGIGEAAAGTPRLANGIRVAS